MSLKSTEWFIDTFPAIVGLSADSSDGSEVSEPPTASSQPSTPLKLLADDCDGDENLRSVCEKYCQVNNETYIKGLAVLVSPIAGIMAADSPRLIAHLVALSAFKDRFCIIPPLPVAPRSFSSLIKEAFAQKQTTPEQTTTTLLLNLLRFHRPNIASMFEEMFGLNAIPDQIFFRLSTAMVTCCDGGCTARELMACISACGEPCAGPLLWIAVMDDIFNSGAFMLNSGESLINVLESYTLSPEKLSAVWSVASELATATPAAVGEQLFLTSTAAGRRKHGEFRTEKNSELFPKINQFQTHNGSSILTLTGEDVVADLARIIGDQNEDQPSDQELNSSAVYSIGDTEQAGVLSMACIAGASIETALKPFVDIGSRVVSPSSPGITVVDARTDDERERDNTNVISFEKKFAYDGERQVSKDWFSNSVEDDGTDVDDSEDTGSQGLVVLRLKKSVWVDPELEFTDPELSEVENLFLRKLEFFRGDRLIVVGLESTARRLTQLLIDREFPYVCAVAEGFRGITDALNGRRNLIKKLALTEVAGDFRTSTEQDVSQSVVRKQSKLGDIKSKLQQIDTSQVKKKFSSFFSTAKPGTAVTVKASPILVAPTPIVVGRAVAPKVEATFEIGEEFEENEFGQRIGGNSPADASDFSSVDLDHQ